MDSRRENYTCSNATGNAGSVQGEAENDELKVRTHSDLNTSGTKKKLQGSKKKLNHQIDTRDYSTPNISRLLVLNS